MDEGELKDSNGKVANFKNSIILLTGNVGHNSFSTQKKGQEGFRVERDTSLPSLLKFN